MSLTLSQVAELTDSELQGNPDYIITGVGSLESATSSDAAFFTNPAYTSGTYTAALKKSQAGVIFVRRGASHLDGRQVLIAENPRFAFQTLLEYFSPENITGFPGIHVTAIIHKTASIGNDVTIGPYVVIDKDSTVGDNTSIGAGTSVGIATTIGTDCIIHPNVTIRERCTIGNRVIIQPGAVIGSCGYGYITNSNGKHIKLKHVGPVIIHDDVEIGANTAIDRARFTSTEIGSGSKIDNLVQIGHGARIGTDNLIVAQVGIAGSAETKSHVVIGGQSGVNGHITISDGVMIAARSGVTKSIKKAGKCGHPPINLNNHLRNQVHILNIGKLVDRIKKLEKRCEKE